MPSAGAVCPPTIAALRKGLTGKPSNYIDTTTYIELDSESPGCTIYFTTDGSRPTPTHASCLAKESTFKYKGPFTLRQGKRTLKTIAVSRDGLKESNVVTKTFHVDNAGSPDDNCDLESVTSRDENDFQPVRSHNEPQRAIATRNSFIMKKSAKISSPREVWGQTSNDNIAYRYELVDKPLGPSPQDLKHGSTHNSVRLPDGPINPTNYSGTQINFWGVSPSNIPAWANMGGGGFSEPYEAKLGAMTNRMLQNADQPRLSIADLRQLIQAETERMQARQPPPQPLPPAKVVEYVTKEPELRAISNGNGDWQGQVEHIYAHLLDICQSDKFFRSKLGAPQLGKFVRFNGEHYFRLENVTYKKIVSSDLYEEDDAYTLTLSLLKAGHSTRTPPKRKIEESPPPTPPYSPPSPPPKAAPPKLEPPKPVEKKVAEKPKPPMSMKTAAKAASIAVKPPPKPKEKTKEEVKEEKLKQRDPFFETEDYKAEGTLKPWPTFSAEADCEKLKKAMKGLGTDEKAIIDVLGYRNSNQRQEIVLTFKTMFGKDLMKELESELSGNFKECCKSLCLPPDLYDATEIKRAVKGLGTDEDALIEILCTRTNAQIKAISAAYKKEFNKEMEKDVVDDTSGNFKKLLVSQMQGNRDESSKFDRTAAQDDAHALFEAGEAHWGTEESKFNEILCQRSFAHLRAVFEEYDKISKKGGMEAAIKSEFSGDIKNGLLAVVAVIRDKPGYFASKLEKAMKGLGTDDKALVRIIVSRCEIDMVQIKESFQQQYKKSLQEWIKGDTSGDYMQMLFALTGDRAAPPPTAAETELQGEPEIEQVEEEHIQRDGTLKPANPFDPKADCEKLKKAMKGLGTDEAAIISVMGFRSTDQRVEIVKMYKTMFGKDLIAELKSECSGNFSHVLTSLCKTPAERDADELRKAMKGLGTDEECLIEILCTRSNQEIKDLTEQYQLRHKKKLEESIKSETSGCFKNLLVSMLQANRPEGNTIDRRKARADAQALFEAGEKRWGTDESRFNAILCSRSYAHLRATFEEYKKISGKDIIDSIASEMSGDLKKGYTTIVEFMRGQAAECAKTLYTAMKGLGTNDLSLIRTVVDRCEVDMVQIKQEFEKNYKQPLGKFIQGDTSGDYRKILLTLTGEQQYIK